MKKLFLLFLIIPFVSFGQSPTEETILLQVGDLLDAYPNAACGYYDTENNLLFDGGDFEANSADTKKVDQYRCACFSGEYWKSDAVMLIWWAWPTGETSFLSVDFATGDEDGFGEVFFSFYRNQEGGMSVDYE